MDKLLRDISFKTNDKKLVAMFNETAEEIAKLLEKEDSIKTTQFRKFYDKILELNNKGQSVVDEEEFKITVLPFVKMLISKVEYSKTRKLCKNNFVSLMRKSISKVNSVEELQNFKYFLEAIIGFMPKN